MRSDMEVMELAEDTVIIHEPVGPYDLVPLLQLLNDPNDKIRAAAIETLKLLPVPSVIKNNVTQLCNQTESNPIEIEFYKPKLLLDVDDWFRSLPEITASAAASEPD